MKSRERIDRTKPLTLQQRIDIVDNTNLVAVNMNDKARRELGNIIIKQGYEPMMFVHAFRIVSSKLRKERKETPIL